ncbi:ATP-binding protein [Candidatus Woesearchaeota archaeon]|nr:ATP-binding protein [Candidatus Woesearchaeota archaeon]
MENKIKIIYKKENEIAFMFSSGLDLRVGDCFKIEDGSYCCIAQIFDLQYSDFPGFFASLLREIAAGADVLAPQSELANYYNSVRDARIARCKIRGNLINSNFLLGSTILPSRNSKVSVIPEDNVAKLIGFKPKKPAQIGKFLKTNSEFNLDLTGLQGITLITGKKGSGKSHLSKKIVEELIKNKAPIVILDVNGEYSGLKEKESGGKSSYHDLIIELIPTKNFLIPLDGIRFETFARMCQIDDSHNAYRLFSRYWNENREGKDLDNLQDYIEESGSHQNTVTAAVGRIEFAKSLNIFGDFDLSKDLKKVKSSGGAIIINMFAQGQKVKELSIVYVLNQLIRAGEYDKGRIFLFAEEAQNYFEEEFWDDVITRMRHLGIYSVIITNEPTTLPEMVFRQCDNLFAFNFSNSADISFISKAQVIDPESLLILKNLGRGEAVLIGQATNNFPFVIKVDQIKVKAGGETKLLW